MHRVVCMPPPCQLSWQQHNQLLEWWHIPVPGSSPACLRNTSQPGQTSTPLTISITYTAALYGWPARQSLVCWLIFHGLKGSVSPFLTQPCSVSLQTAEALPALAVEVQDATRYKVPAELWHQVAARSASRPCRAISAHLCYGGLRQGGLTAWFLHNRYV